MSCVLLTGGAGFIGGVVARPLRERGDAEVTYWPPSATVEAERGFRARPIDAGFAEGCGGS